VSGGNVIQQRSFEFAVRIIKLCRYMATDLNERVLSKQLIRSGTSVGANVEEGIHAQSRKDFVHKLYIARKETRETLYWLRLLVASEIVTEAKVSSLIQEANEIHKILSSIILTTEQRNNQPKATPDK